MTSLCLCRKSLYLLGNRMEVLIMLQEMACLLSLEVEGQCLAVARSNE
jgi:hypothetical protein